MTRAEALSIARIRHIPLPEGISGATMPRHGGGYLIAINSDLSAEAQAQTLEHELAHIRLEHFTADAEIDVIEAEAEELTMKETRGRRPVGW